MLKLANGMPSFPQPLVQLPWTFDAERLQWEIDRFSDEEWIGHPERFAGNRALVLISTGGGRNNDFAISGPMAPTRALGQSPYLQQVVAAFGSEVSRSRLMWLDAGATVPAHRDTGYHWYRRIRLHVPVHTAPAVTFSCGGQQVHMAAGESWAFDHRLPHTVTNGSPAPRIHLVVDTRGTPALRGAIENGDARQATRHVPFLPATATAVDVEPYRFEVLTPEELAALADAIRAGTPSGSRSVVESALADAQRQWRGLFDRAGHAAAEGAYYVLITGLWRVLRDVSLDNDAFHAARVLATMLDTSNGIAPATAAPAEAMPPDAPLEPLSRCRRRPAAAATWPPTLTRILDTFEVPHTIDDAQRLLPTVAPASVLAAVQAAIGLQLLEEDFSDVVIERPLFIVSAPRSGSSMLFELLQHADGLWSTGVESHSALEHGTGLHPRDRGWSSNRLTADDMTPALGPLLIDRLASRAANRTGTALRALPRSRRPRSIRLLDKTPKNALRVPFLRSLFPDAQFVFLSREPRGALSSLIEGWRSGRFVTYPDLPDWPYWPWSFLLPADWHQLRGAPLADIAAFQWAAANRQLLEDLEALPSTTWMSVEYDDLVADPTRVVRAVAEFAGCPFDEPLARAAGADQVPLSRFTLLPPDPDKWRKHEHLIAPLLPGLAPIESALASLRIPLRIGRASESGGQLR